MPVIIIQRRRQSYRQQRPTYRARILDTVLLHDHWRKLIRRRVQMSENDSSSLSSNNTIIVDFELVGQRDPDQAVLIFVWHHRQHDRRTRNSNTSSSNNDQQQEEKEEEDTITVVREYMPSQDAFGYGLAAGMVDESDDGDVEGAARRELVEECGLHGGTWHCLTPLSSSNGGVVLDKYCTTKTTVYLVINPTPVSGDHHSIHLLHRDDAAETGMQTITVGWSQFRNECLPNMTVVGAWASMLALERIQRLRDEDDDDDKNDNDDTEETTDGRR
jgi:8-oxo-dGTP pyrophosphatase MutT (NUDIX family)